MQVEPSHGSFKNRLGRYFGKQNRLPRSDAEIARHLAVDKRWRNARRFALAGTLLAFPFLFIMDAWWDPAISPVIPGLIALVALWVIGPFALMELWSRHVLDDEVDERRHARSRYLLGAAAMWLLFWLVFLL